MKNESSGNGFRDLSAEDNASTTSRSLLRRARAADPQAWEQLTRLYSPVVYNWARRAGLQPEDASDVMQNVFHALASGLQQFERRAAKDSFRGWLYTITKNKVCDHFRSKRCQEQAIGGTAAQEMWQRLPDTPPKESSASGMTEISGIRQRALDLLSGKFANRTWQAFYRTTVQSDTPQDVASDLGISVWAVYKARARVLAKLRVEFEDLLS